MSNTTFNRLLANVRACRLCAAQLPLGPNPVLRASRTAHLLIIGQGPATRILPAPPPLAT